jgi:hypothetical protein
MFLGDGAEDCRSMGPGPDISFKRDQAERQISRTARHDTFAQYLYSKDCPGSVQTLEHVGWSAETSKTMCMYYTPLQSLVYTLSTCTGLKPYILIDSVGGH